MDPATGLKLIKFQFQFFGDDDIRPQNNRLIALVHERDIFIERQDVHLNRRSPGVARGPAALIPGVARGPAAFIPGLPTGPLAAGFLAAAAFLTATFGLLADEAIPFLICMCSFYCLLVIHSRKPNRIRRKEHTVNAPVVPSRTQSGMIMVHTERLKVIVTTMN